MDVLGDTREAIAAEKLAVVQPGATVVLGEPEWQAARRGERRGRSRADRAEQPRARARRRRGVPRPARRTRARPRTSRCPAGSSAEARARSRSGTARTTSPASPTSCRACPSGDYVLVSSILADKRPELMLEALSVLGRTLVATQSSNTPLAPGRGTRRPRRTVLRPCRDRCRSGRGPAPCAGPGGPGRGRCSSRAPSIFLPTSVAPARPIPRRKAQRFRAGGLRPGRDRRRRVCRGLFDRQNVPVIASTFGSTHDFFSSGTWLVIRNLMLFFAGVFWLAIASLGLQGRAPADRGSVARRRSRRCSGRRRRSSGRSSTCSSGRRSTSRTCASASSRSRRWRTGSRSATCTVRCAASEVDSSFLVCPICTTKLKQSCVTCKAPLEALWQVCPFCETPVEPTAVALPALRERVGARRAE